LSNRMFLPLIFIWTGVGDAPLVGVERASGGVVRYLRVPVGCGQALFRPWQAVRMNVATSVKMKNRFFIVGSNM
jgi:hypothetical protein